MEHAPDPRGGVLAHNYQPAYALDVSSGKRYEVALSAGQVAVVPTIVTRKLSRTVIRGLAQLSDGTPVAAAEIHAFTVGEVRWPAGSVSAIADAQGGFTLELLDGVAYTVRATRPDVFGERTITAGARI